VQYKHNFDSWLSLLVRFLNRKLVHLIRIIYKACEITKKCRIFMYIMWSGGQFYDRQELEQLIHSVSRWIATFSHITKPEIGTFWHKLTFSAYFNRHSRCEYCGFRKIWKRIYKNVLIFLVGVFGHYAEILRF